MLLLEKTELAQESLGRSPETSPRLERLALLGRSRPSSGQRPPQPVLLNLSTLSEVEAIRAVIKELPDHEQLAAIDPSNLTRSNAESRVLEAARLAKSAGLLNPVYGRDITTGALRLRHRAFETADGPVQEIDFREPEVVILLDEADVSTTDLAGLPEALTPHVRQIYAFAVPEGFQPLEQIE